ncbi:MAG TPA: helix-turn-helix transcriptional regulator [Methylocella sp.]|nr:helix-turn-helix transcriptional regulator [Methylocella sp.]
MVLPEAEYERLVEKAEMAADIAAYDEAKRKLASGAGELIPTEMAHRLLDGENPIRVWREHRGLSLSALAEQTGISQPFLSQIEAGKREGTLSTLAKIAAALSLTIDDLVPAGR